MEGELLMIKYIISILVLLLISSCSDKGDGIAGCMVETACNYNVTALEDDGSCLLPVGDACISFANDIQPILTSNCTGCHGDPDPSQGLDLSSYANLMSGNIITAGDAQSSLLYQKITGTASGGRMPASDPDYFDSHADELQLIEYWINEGANDN